MDRDRPDFERSPSSDRGLIPPCGWSNVRGHHDQALTEAERPGPAVHAISVADAPDRARSAGIRPYAGRAELDLPPAPARPRRGFELSLPDDRPGSRALAADERARPGVRNRQGAGLPPGARSDGCV